MTLRGRFTRAPPHAVEFRACSVDELLLLGWKTRASVEVRHEVSRVAALRRVEERGPLIPGEDFKIDQSAARSDIGPSLHGGITCITGLVGGLHQIARERIES